MSADSLIVRTERAISDGQLLRRGEPVVVAVSGGADSVALLDVLTRLAVSLEVSLHVGHLDHGLRSDSAEDAAFVASLARRQGIPATLAVTDVAAHAARDRLSVEEAGRQTRYAFLGALARSVGASRIVTGHHADDQAETVLARPLRGAGLDGLGGMRPLAPLPPPTQGIGWAMRGAPDLRADAAATEVWLARPFLALPHREILAYVAARGLAYRDDPSNRDTTLLRNRIRHDLLPQLATYNPAIVATLARTARSLSDDADILSALADAAWVDVAQETDAGVDLALAALANQPLALRRRLLRRAVAAVGSLRDVGGEHIERGLALAARGEPGAKVHLPGGIILTRSYDTLIVGQGATPDPDWPLLPADCPPLAVAVPGVTPLPGSEWTLRVEIGDWRLEEVVADSSPPLRTGLRSVVGEEVIDAAAAEGGLWLRGRQPGDRFQPLGMGGHSRSLHDFMVDSHIPRHLRDRVPLLVNARHMVWVGGLRLDERARVTADTREALRLRLARRPAA